MQTAHPRIMLGGIRCDFPVVLMERAATASFLAANDFWTVPIRPAS
jgi:hypothetical protein